CCTMSRAFVGCHYFPTRRSSDLGEIAGHFYEEGIFHSSKDNPATITVLEDSPFIVKVKVEGYIASHPMVQIITLEAGQRRIDFDLTVDWQRNVDRKSVV